jgi:hypothetical protein
MATATELQVNELISTLKSSEEQFYTDIGIPLRSPDIDQQEMVKKRIKAICAMFLKLEDWFISPQDSWHWYTEQKIPAFGNITATELVMQEQDAGIAIVMDYIEIKNLGGFE